MGWRRFTMVRAAVFALCAISSAAVLGLAAYQAGVLMGNQYDKPYIIFALIVSAISLLMCGGLSIRYHFKTHVGAIAFMWILWLSLASYTTDRIGYVQCESLDGQRRSTRNGGTYNDVTWCRMLKAMMGFSWFNFGILSIAIVSWIRLSEDEERKGYGGYGSDQGSIRREVRREERREEVGEGRRYPLQGAYPAGATLYPGQTGQTVVYQQPGHNVVLQNGQIRQVPVGQAVYQ